MTESQELSDNLNEDDLPVLLHHGKGIHRLHCLTEDDWDGPMYKRSGLILRAGKQAFVEGDV